MSGHYAQPAQGPSGRRRLHLGQQGPSLSRSRSASVTPKYGKMMTTTKKLHAHDEECTAGLGDKVPHHGDPSSVQDEALAPG